MTDKSNDKGSSIPKTRTSRLTMLGSMAGKVAGSVIGHGLTEIAKGNRVKLSELVLTPKNVKRFTTQLSQMRGAAMKVGQLLSMDAGDVLPPELADILAQLRADAKPMPQAELQGILSDAWGDDWRQQFIQFSEQPIAAASIGQVHKAITQDLQRLAVKVQYPGIKQSIDSDVDNVYRLIAMTGLLPKNLDIKPLLSEAKAQLHEEADYALEGHRLNQYADVIAGQAGFTMPTYVPALSSETILCMSFVDGTPIESMESASQTLRNAIVSGLFGLLFRELFEFQLVQTDPNFANFQYDEENQRIVLLDFGATREYSPEMAMSYRQLMSAAIDGDRLRILKAALDIGLLPDSLDNATQHLITEMCVAACEPICNDSEYDFGATNLSQRLRDQGLTLGLEQQFAHTPPANAIFLHRKLGGLFFLAIRLKAKINVRQLFEPYRLD